MIVGLIQFWVLLISVFMFGMLSLRNPSGYGVLFGTYAVAASGLFFFHYTNYESVAVPAGQFSGFSLSQATPSLTLVSLAAIIPAIVYYVLRLRLGPNQSAEDVARPTRTATVLYVASNERAPAIKLADITFSVVGSVGSLLGVATIALLFLP